MDNVKFDALTRAFAKGTSRRTAIKGLFGGAVGVAVAGTHLTRAGAAECSPETVLEDCPLENECQTAFCDAGVCAWTNLCSGTELCCGSYCAECCVSDDCEDSCDICDSGACVFSCSACQEYDGVCCDGAWIPEGQCCDVGDCVGPVDTFCSSVACIDYLCTVVPECPANHFCCGYGEEGAYCAFCCEDNQCDGSFDYCYEGHCYEGECLDDSDCYGECTICSPNRECVELICLEGSTCCGGGQCVPEDECCKGPGDLCGLLLVDNAGIEGSPQYDCCDGLVCCDQWGDMGPTCAQCCNDWDCPKGAWCNRGWCEWPDEECDHDKDCPKGTCCCKDGSCSGKCCDKPHPPKPPKPPKPAPTPDAPVTTLPATGVGQSDERNGLLGATALGAAAALYAAKKMRETPEAQSEN